jgi:2-oxoglutarate dehydrogenase E2 component (dihydrolipoamide succinyltransferase)
MSIDVEIPALGESVTEGVIVRWIKSDGEAVATDEPLFELETDKASVEIPAPSAGVVHILKPQGATVQVGEVVARIDADGAGKGDGKKTEALRPPAGEGEPPSGGEPRSTPEAAGDGARQTSPSRSSLLSPAVRRLVEEHGLDPAQIESSGRGGRLTKADVLAHIGRGEERGTRDADQERDEGRGTRGADQERGEARGARGEAGGEVERVPMTRLRQRIAERMLEAQRTAAILTTFNEVDMSGVLDLRARFKEEFKKKHGVGLGFMSFFARACISALHDMPLINARIEGTDVVYNKSVHLGVAVSTERGLVVPVLHAADGMSFAAIEREIERLAGLARDNKLAIDDLSGGTFTISNGGVFGSLLSTPILNPPQSAILGMHKTEKRPVVVGDEIVIRPMMYLALSYDHRLVDGAGAVTFLVKVKERIEDPVRLLFDV